MAENLTVRITADTSSAQANIDRLTKGVDKVSAAFTGLKAKILGLGIAAMGRSVLAMADELQDLSDSTGIATGRLLEFKKALTVSGGEAEMMPRAINQFIRSIDEAAQGSIKAQNAFYEVGVSLQDLQTLGENELMIKTLEGIAKVDDAGRRATLMMDKFGKSFKSVDPGALAEKLRATAGEGDAYAKSIKEAADLNDQLATSAGNLKLAFLQTFAPVIRMLADFSNGVADSKQKMETLISIMKTIATVAAVAFAFTAWGAAVRIIGTIGRGVAALIGMFSSMGASIASTFSATGVVMTALRGVGGLIAGIAAGIGTVLGLTDKKPEAGAGRGGQGGPSKEEMDALNKQQEQAQKMRDIDTQARQNAIRGIKEITNEYAKQNVLSLKRIGLEAELIGLSDEEKQARLAQDDLAQKFLDIQDQLIKRRETLTSEEKYLVPIINEQINKAKQLYQEQSIGLTNVLAKQQVAIANEKDRQIAIEQITKQMERQATLADQLRSANEKLKDIQFETSTMKMTPIQKQIAKIEEEARKGALEAGRAFANSFTDDGDGLTMEKSQELADGLELIAQRYRTIADEQLKNLEVSRTFEQGWTEAFNNYMDSATNAANRARDVFSAVTNNMDRMLENFVDTGKLNFGDLARSIIADLLKIELKASAMNLWKILGATGGGGGGGGGGILGTVWNWGKSLLGFADGGMPPVGKASIVGENGPELFVPKTAGNIVPNNQMGGTNYYITNNISAIDAKSVAQLFAENRRALLGTVRLAEKEMPSRR